MKLLYIRKIKLLFILIMISVILSIPVPVYAAQQDGIIDNHPILCLMAVYDGTYCYDDSITLEGYVKNYDYFTINDKEVPVEGDWTFKYDYALKEGENTIVIKAEDLAGNITQYTAHVTRLVEVEKPIPWAKIIMIASIIMLVGLYVFFTIKSKNEDKPKKTKKDKKEKKQKDKAEEDYADNDRKVKIEADPKTVRRWIIDIVEIILPIVTVYIMFTKIFMIATVQSGSMEPTLLTGNTVLYNRLAYTKYEPARGDIVIFWSDERQELLGKRIIGVGGDTIEFIDGQVVVNGVFIDESAYIDDEIETNCTKTFEVPEGCYFMLGDNRENSLDARYWVNPYIPKENIMGRYMGQIDFSFQFDVIGKFFGSSNNS